MFKASLVVHYLVRVQTPIPSQWHKICGTSPLCPLLFWRRTREEMRSLVGAEKSVAALTWHFALEGLLEAIPMTCFLLYFVFVVENEGLPDLSWLLLTISFFTTFALLAEPALKALSACRGADASAFGSDQATSPPVAPLAAADKNLPGNV